ncbi:MAG: AAA family ATPase, partial [Melioribacteraceae bacterium]
MQSKDLKSLLLKLNNYLVRNLDTATGHGIKINHYEINMEHLLIALLEEGLGDVPLILKYFGINAGDVQERCVKNLNEIETGNSGRPKLSPLLTDLLEKAWMMSSVHLHETKIRSGALFASFVSSELVISTGMMGIFSPIKEDDLRTEFYKIVQGSSEDAHSGTDGLPEETVKEIPPDGTVLDLYTMNLTQQAKDGKIDPILGRDEEIIQTIEVLSRRKKSNPILLGEPGVGKTAVVEGLALKVAANEVPDIIKGVQIHSLDMGSLQAGTKMRGEFEKRLKAVITEVTNSVKPIILFIDEAHTLIGAGASAGGSDAANLLKPALARGELRAVGATTLDEYQKHFEKDKALTRRFQTVLIDEPDTEDAISILRGIKEKYETYHKVLIKDEAIIAAVELSQRYITDRHLPDKAIDLIDEAASKLRMEINSKPEELDEIERKIMQLEIEREAIKREKDTKKLNKIGEELAELNDSKNQITAKWMTEKNCVEAIQNAKENIEILKTEADQAERDGNYEKVAEIRYGKIKDTELKLETLRTELIEIQKTSNLIKEEVDAIEIADVVAKWTGIPIAKMLQSEREKLLFLEEKLGERVVGQKEGIEAISDAVRRSRAGLQDMKKPIGSFIFLGTTGVGKTELAKALSEYLFND